MAHVILRTNRLSSAGSLLNELHWLQVASRIQFKIATLTHKILSTGTPSYLSSLLSHYKPTRQLRSSSSNLLVQPPSKTKFGSSCISNHCISDLEWPASRCQVITFLSDLQENVQNSLFPQPSHLGHVHSPAPQIRFDWPTRTLSLWPWRVSQIVVIIIIMQPALQGSVLEVFFNLTRTLCRKWTKFGLIPAYV